MGIMRHETGAVYLVEGTVGTAASFFISSATDIPLGLLGLSFLGGRAFRGSYLNRDSMVLGGGFFLVGFILAYLSASTVYWSFEREGSIPLTKIIETLVGQGVGFFAPSLGDKKQS